MGTPNIFLNGGGDRFITRDVDQVGGLNTFIVLLGLKLLYFSMQRLI